MALRFAALIAKTERSVLRWRTHLLDICEPFNDKRGGADRACPFVHFYPCKLLNQHQHSGCC